MPSIANNRSLFIPKAIPKAIPSRAVAERARSIVAAFFAAAFVVAAIPAQRTWVVDHAAGAGHDFTSITPAVAVAGAGDVIVVREGSYSEPQLRIGRGISIFGEGTVDIAVAGVPGSLFGILVQDLPADETFALRGVRLEAGVGITDFRALRCAGGVSLSNLTGSLDRVTGIETAIYLSFVDCSKAYVNSVFVRGGSLRFARSRGVVAGSVFEGATAPVLTAVDSSVFLTGPTITQDLAPLAAGAPITLESAELVVAGGAIASNRGLIPQSAIHAVGSTVVLDPSVTLDPAPGRPAVSGDGTVLQREVTALGARRRPSVVELAIQSRPGALFATVASLPGPVIPSPYGDLWFNPAFQSQVDAGLLTTRVRQSQIPVPPLPPGLAIDVQSVVLLPNGDVETTNGVIVVF